ncbi:MAG: DUF2628 domain-containing protein [Clostridia bacterium]|nr:DUF2628 domain-containing protein [Clostridia bacterium]
MDFKKVVCAACGRPFAEGDDIVVCPVCGSPQHRSCYDLVGQCVNHDKHGSFIFDPPAEEHEKTEKRRTDDIFCPFCSWIIPSDSEECPRCGGPLRDKNTGEPIFEREALVSPAEKIDGIPSREFTAIIGPRKFVKYLSSFKYGVAKGRWRPHLPAMILGPVWFLYRKIYRPALILLAVQCLLFTAYSALTYKPATGEYFRNIISAAQEASSGGLSLEEFQGRLAEVESDYAEAYEEQTTSRDGVIQVVWYCLSLGADVVFGFFGNKLYFAECKRKILASRPKCSDMEGYMDRLKMIGGTSPGLAFLGMLAIVSYPSLLMLLLVFAF